MGMKEGPCRRCYLIAIVKGEQELAIQGREQERKGLLNKTAHAKVRNCGCGVRWAWRGRQDPSARGSQCCAE